MAKIFYALIGILLSAQMTFADGGILGDFAAGRTEGEKVTETAIRTGDIHLEDIPNMISSAINFFMGIAGTIAIIFIIIGAYKILFGSLEQDKTKGKDTIIMALGGFAIAALAWFIIKLIVENLSK